MPLDTAAAPLTAHLVDALGRAAAHDAPFRHWRLRDVLPAATCAALRALPFAPPQVEDTRGRRETHNSTRIFFGREAQAAHPVCAEAAAAFQAAATVTRLERLCGTSPGGGHLRVEYCLDTDGFWLEPHTDIGAKLFTLLIYLSTDPGCEDWGTDLLRSDGTLVERAPGVPDSGLLFLPGPDTWHGFAPRRIAGVRRSLIVNYVREEWRARHELAFPDRFAGR